MHKNMFDVAIAQFMQGYVPWISLFFGLIWSSSSTNMFVAFRACKSTVEEVRCENALYQRVVDLVHIPILFSPSTKMTRSSHVPVILGETERSVWSLGAWGFWMLLTKKHVCYNCPNHLQPSGFGSDNVQLGGQCLQSISVGSRIWLYEICLIGEHFWPKIFLKIVSA